MADWYVSSATYATYTAFQTSHLYSIGDILVPTAPATRAKWVFRCTTGGTSSTEPNWTGLANGNNNTIASGTATFTNVTGQSAFFWTSAAGDLPTLTGQVGGNRFQAGDRIFVSSDHSETQTLSSTYGSGSGATAAYNLGQILSVNRAGSTPPVAADLTAGATVIVNFASCVFETAFPIYHYGITYDYINSSSSALLFNNGNLRTLYFDNCTLWLNNATANTAMTNNNPAHVILNNSILKFGAATHRVNNTSYPLQLEWQNGGSVAGTSPNILFESSSVAAFNATCRGVDLSAVTGALFSNSSASTGTGSKFLFESCKIAPAVIRFGQSQVTSVSASDHDTVELLNCYDGTNIISEIWQAQGNVTTEFTQYLSSGAQDDVGNFSHRMIANNVIDKFVAPLCGFWIDVEYSGTLNVSKTATVDILSTSNFNNDEVSLLLEYEGTSGSSQTSFGSSLPATILTSATAVSSSGSTWISPAIPWGMGGYASSTTTSMASGNAGAASIYLTKVTLVNTATITAVLLGIQANPPGLVNIRAVIYDSTPSVLKAQSNMYYGSIVFGINRFTLTSPISLSAGTYYVGYVSDVGYNVWIDTSQTSSSWFVSGSQSVTSPANPLVGGSSQNNGLQVALEFSNAAQAYGWGPDYTANVALSSSNQIATFSSSGATGVRSVTIQSPQLGGKYYCEVLIGGTVASTCSIQLEGACDPPAGTSSNFYSIQYNQAGTLTGKGVTVSGSPSSWTAGDVIGVAYDATNGRVWVNKNNGTWFGGSGTNTPSSGLGGVTFDGNLSFLPFMIAAVRASGSTAAVFTIQDRSGTQTYSPPSGFVAWSGSTPVAQNLQVTFTPQHKGRVRGQVRLGRPGIVYYNPQITIS